MKSIEELKNEVRNVETMDDIIEAIIYKSGKVEIPKSQAFLQQAFHDLKENSPDLFVDFIFDESGITPFSDELDSVLFRLEASAILSTLNPTYKNYAIMNSPEVLRASYEKLEHRRSEIDKCGELFAELVTEVGRVA